MYHDITLRCGRFMLRPVTLQDAEFIFQLRTNPQVGRFIVNTSSTLQQQIAWLERYFERPGDYYFVVQHVDSGESHGTIAIYDLDQNRRTAEWGRWLIKPGSLCALPSARMIYEYAFEFLNVELLYCRTQEANAKVISFHDSFGAVKTTVMADDPLYGGRVIEHRLAAAQWPVIRNRTQALIERLTRAE